MKAKKIVGAVLAFLGGGWFMFALVVFLVSFGEERDGRIPFTAAMLGIIFSSAGVALVSAALRAEEIER
jgi:hypothetical protein